MVVGALGGYHIDSRTAQVTSRCARRRQEAEFPLGNLSAGEVLPLWAFKDTPRAGCDWSRTDGPARHKKRLFTSPRDTWGSKCEWSKLAQHRIDYPFHHCCELHFSQHPQTPFRLPVRAMPASPDV